MKKKLLELLRENARYTCDELAEILNTTPDKVAAEIAKLEKNGTVCGYTAVINDAELKGSQVKAIIEVKITPRRDGGFDDVARRIAKFPEVTDLFLISGGYDLQLTVCGQSLQEVANFVAAKLATIDGVLSTSTGFMLRKYKESGKLMKEDENYERQKVCL